ncbi:MAG: Ycf34 family protein, partial [Cyanobium sp.]
MCICVNCRWVDRCQAYHAVERQHGVAHLSSSPDFQPRQPRIHVQVLDLPGGGVGV